MIPLSLWLTLNTNIRLPDVFGSCGVTNALADYFVTILFAVLLFYCTKRLVAINKYRSSNVKEG